jgi:lysophospholipase L1-like esterase
VQPAYQPDAMGRWQTQPSLSAHTMTGLREPHNFRVTTNAHGLRTLHPTAAAEDELRVAVMGDSTVFGWGVEDTESIAATAEAALSVLGRTELKVINAGQPGYSTAMAGWLFEQAVAGYRPDLTIVFVSMHDFNRTLISDVERHLGPQSLSAQVRALLVRHVRLYALLRKQIYPLAHEAQLLPDRQSKEARVPRVSDPERHHVLRRMQDLADTWGGKITVGFLPFHRDLMGDAPGDRPGLEQAEAWSASHSVPVFDLRACCGPGADARTFDFDRGHLNALGNREVGDALAQALIVHLPSQIP